jgi:AraC family transcriptional regulator
MNAVGKKQIRKAFQAIAAHCAHTLDVRQTGMENPNWTDSTYISMNIYSDGQKVMMSLTNVFDKWAAVAVSSLEAIPDGMESYTLQGGKYAVFIHKGPASAFPKTMQHIFVEWLPKSGFEIDDREHFEVLPEDYGRNDSEAEEEVWIPIK